MKIPTIIALVLINSAVLAQNLIDKSDDGLSQTTIDTLKIAFLRNLIDPLSAQIARLRGVKDDWICGNINAKGISGGYAGFTTFAFKISTGTLSLSPAPSRLQFTNWAATAEGGQKIVAEICGPKAPFYE